jgi:hypothetical protein
MSHLKKKTQNRPQDTCAEGFSKEDVLNTGTKGNVSTILGETATL